jgi:hypothetical protein
VQIEDGKDDSVLFNPGPYDPLSVHVTGNRVVYTAYKPDCRWHNQSFAEVRLLNLQSKKEEVLTTNSRCFSPALSPDGRYLAFVEQDSNAVVSLKILLLSAGLCEYSLTDSLFGWFSMLSWDERSQCLVAVHTNDAGKAVVKIDISQKASGKLIPFSFREIYDPILLGDTLIYVSGCANKPELFAYLPMQNKHYQLTSTFFGAAFPSSGLDSRELIYAEYTANGYKPRKKLLAEMRWLQPDTCLVANEAMLAKFAQNELVADSGIVEDTPGTLKPYRKFHHLFRFHSYGPYASDNTMTEIKPGFTFLSQNLLSTSFTTLGYEYDLDLKEDRFFVNYSYRGFYPVIAINADYRNRNGLFNVNDQIIRMNWHEGSVKTSVNLPLQWTVGNWNRYFTPQVFVRGVKRQEYDNQPASFKHHQWIVYGADMVLANFMRSGIRNMYPKYGQALQIGYQWASLSGSQFSAEGLLYVPGFLRHHGIKLYAAYERQNDGDLSFSRAIALPRGHSPIYSAQLWAGGFTYKLPVLYPDVSLGPLAYIKRVKLAVFSDVAFDQVGNYSSVGCELSSDMHLLRFVAPVDLGFRASFLPDTHSWAFGFLVYVNFSQL